MYAIRRYYGENGAVGLHGGADFDLQPLVGVVSLVITSYSIHYTKLYEAIPAVVMIQASLNAHRGCAGGCSFCTLALHQGRRIRSRSRESVLAEAKVVASAKGFSGSISDVGGPSANMWNAACAADPSRCARASCLTPAPCKHFKADQAGFVQLLRDVSATPRNNFV